MPLFERIRYALQLAIVVNAIILLTIALASSDSVALIPSSAFDLILSPAALVASYVISFLVAPFFITRLPFKR